MLLTSEVYIAYSISMLFYGFKEILNKIFYSFQDSKSP
ncbi:MAG: hypothetical protein IPK06_02285 [Ignavibacteriae bacterium]|nr:hypothetical protein [Ignavibacteriota bacterium]